MKSVRGFKMYGGDPCGLMQLSCVTNLMGDISHGRLFFYACEPQGRPPKPGQTLRRLEEFTTDEATALFDIANQCPLVGGNAVFRARALYALVDADQEFDDPTLCLLEGLITKNVVEKDQNSVLMLPNPANEMATLVLTKPLEATGWLVFFNSVGAEVMTLRVPAEQMQFTFGTATLAPGMYHYLVRSAESQLGEGKLSVTH